MDNKKRYEKTAYIQADAANIFAYADNHANFSSHMNTSSWMMGGGSMNTEVDADKGQKVGSHIKMSGTVFGVQLYLDEVITVHNPPHKKEWQTVGDINLLVIDHYTLGFEITPQESGTILKVYIDYLPPRSARTYLIGLLFGHMYAKWCVEQMIKGVTDHFSSKH